MTKQPGWAPPPGYIVLTRPWDGAKVLVPAEPKPVKETKK